MHHNESNPYFRQPSTPRVRISISHPTDIEFYSAHDDVSSEGIRALQIAVEGYLRDRGHEVTRLPDSVAGYWAVDDGRQIHYSRWSPEGWVRDVIGDAYAAALMGDTD